MMKTEKHFILLGLESLVKHMIIYYTQLGDTKKHNYEY